MKIIKPDQMWNASFYDKYATPQFEIAVQALSQWEFKGNESILDIGCGNGAITSLIANKYSPNGSVTGIDLSNDMINFAQNTFKAKNLEFKAIDACQINENEKFDIVFSFYCLHWIKDQEKVFQKIVNSLKQKAKFLLYVMTDSNDNNYSLTKFIKDAINLPKWENYFKDYTIPWYFQTQKTVTDILSKMNLNTKIDLLSQEIIFKNKEAAISWLKAVPLAAQVPNQLQQILMNDLVDNYFKCLNINEDGTFSFILPTLKITAEKI